MKLGLWHLKDQLAMIRHQVHREAHAEPRFPADYERVATIEAANLDHAFGITDSHDRNWAAKPEVTNPLAAELRNTSVGDVYVADDGAHRTENFGFSRVEGWEAERIDAAAIKRAAGAIGSIREPHQEDFSW